MTHAVILLSLVAVAVAEAPYSLPRPSQQQQTLNYPAANPSRPQNQYHQQQAAQNFNTGYHYQQPSIGPAFVQVGSQPNYPQSQPQYQLPVSQPQYNPAQSIYQQPQPQPAPQQYYPPASQPQSQPIQQPPSASYGVPQYPVPSQPRPTPEPIQTLPAYIYQPQPQPQPIQVYQPQPTPQVQVFQPQQPQQQGYSYPQPIPQSYLRNNALQQPLQLQLFGGNSLSSYQADTNQYHGAHAQTHKDALDAATVNHVQNIIKENEHNSARNAGYLSLVSGVSLENARPSVEISSFFHNSPLTQGGVSQSYGLPSSQTSQSNKLSSNFLPQTQPATSYGIPK